MIVKKMVIALLLSLMAGAVNALPITAYSVTDGTGNQTYSGALGLDFNVIAPSITITSLGAFDAGGNGIDGPIYVGIYERRNDGSGLLGARQGDLLSFVGNTYPLEDGYRYQDLAIPIVLSAGFEGSVVAWVFDGNDPLGNDNGGAPKPGMGTDDGGGVLAFVDSRFAANNPNANPEDDPNVGWTTTVGAFDCGGNAVSCFAAGNFKYNSVPEPTVLMLFGAGLLGLGLSRRKGLKT
jgi:hypothetical protein